MIHYQLRCSQEHVFDGWFKDSGAFERQARRGLVGCPACGDNKVERALMAPAVPSRRERLPVPVPQPAPPAQGKAQVPVAGGQIPDHLRAVLQRMRAEVEKTCDYVGPQFADEARRIHAGESERRGIYGETTQEQADALAEDGIRVTRIPWVPRADG